MRSFFLCLFFSGLSMGNATAQWRFEGDTSATWEQVIHRYAEFARTRAGVKLMQIGTDDDGSPIHLFILADGSGSTPDSIRASGKNILWITNGIHPGEPDGIDASLWLTQALLDSDQLMGLLVNTAVCIVPVYNVSGARQRTTTGRIDQNGPVEYGRRANARNLDLNRDLMKADSRNTRTLITALMEWDPDVYFETHVSNGADHQYVMELLTTHPDKLDTALRGYLQQRLVPRMHEWMEARHITMGPYFETLHRSPEQGLTGFMDGPRYTTGYNALRQRIGILSESHMLKPYADRVNATFQLMLGTLACMNEHPAELKAARQQARANAEEALHYATNWTVDTTQVDTISWLGYAERQVISQVSGLPQLAYDRTAPTTAKVRWMDHGTPQWHVVRPSAYLIPQAWREVIERLRLDQVPMTVLQEQRTFEVEVQRIADFTNAAQPYEGHYLHRNIATTTDVEMATAFAGDVLVPMGNATDALVMELLEPRCADSFFAWGFFDSILQQKEWFSDYAFEPVAAELLERDPALKVALDAAREEDPEFAKDAWQQLYFVYQRSPYFEPAYRRYPVLRVMD